MTSLKTLFAAALLAGSACAVIYVSDTPGAAARKLVSEGAKLVDVRSPAEYADGHIEGAVNIPVDELEARLAELGTKELPVVVYCRSGRRADRAATLLRERGWRQVHNLGPRSYW
ncbi:MAG: rhodanese-like domain-containing protein [Myxococcaceae bacterium]